MEWQGGSTTFVSHPWIATWPPVFLLSTLPLEVHLSPAGPETSEPTRAGSSWNPAQQVQVTLISVSKSLLETHCQVVPQWSRVTASSWPRSQAFFVFFTAFRRVLDLQTVTRPQNLWRCISLVLRPLASWGGSRDGLFCF